MATLIGVDFGLHDATAFGRVHADGRYEVISPEEFYQAPQTVLLDEQPKITPVMWSHFCKQVPDCPTPPKPYRHGWVPRCVKVKRRATNRAARKARRRNRA